MKNGLTYGLGALLAVFFLTTCRQEAVPVPETGKAISFSASTLVSKSLSEFPGSNDPSYLIATDNQISVYGTWTSDDDSDVQQIFNHQVVTCTNGELNTWTYSPAQFWKTSGKYTFAGVFPSSIATVNNPYNTGKRLILRYSMLEHNLDLMVARTHRNLDESDPDVSRVSLPFKHALAAIRFIFTKGSNAYSYDLTSFQLENIQYLGEFDWSSDTPAVSDWSTQNYNNEPVFAWEATTADPAKTIPVNQDDFEDHWYFALPQALTTTSENKPSLVFSVRFNNDLTPVSTTLKLPDTYTDSEGTHPAVWEPGKVYNYHIHLQPSRVTISVTVTPWEKKNVTTDGDIVFD